MTDNNPILKVNKLTKRFPGVIALDEVEFNLAQGEIHAICGENGAGKSTLIKVLSGIYSESSYEGSFAIDGKTVSFRGINDASASGIAVIYQELALVQEMTVAENIFLGSEPTKMGRIDWNSVYSRTQNLLKTYNLQLNPSARIDKLGVGEQQLVEIVKALSKETRILLLDEPTAALTETEVEILLEIVQGLKKRGITCVYISHKLDEVFAISDRITIIRDGQSIATLQTADTDKNEVIQLMVGREITDLFPRRKSTPGEIVLAVNDLEVEVEGRHKPILSNISFTLRAGEVLGFGGLMGAGRTELLLHIFGAFGQRSKGKVTVNNKTLENNTPRDAIENGMVLISEDRKRYGLVLDQTIGFNLSIASLDKFYHNFLIDENMEYGRNKHFFDSLAVKAPGLETVVGTLSGGNQQKIVLGKGLMTEPSIVFLDEPTRGIDVGSKQEVYELINQLTDEGKAVLLVSSELPELIGMSDRMIILSEGRIGGTFTHDNATQSDILAAAMKHHD
ncbi:MAG: sugar ABC transporter ATP-binding protein [Calditrichia bacterium]